MGIPNNLMPYVQQVALGQRDALSVFGRYHSFPFSIKMFPSSTLNSESSTAFRTKSYCYKDLLYTHSMLILPFIPHFHALMYVEGPSGLLDPLIDLPLEFLM